MSTGQRAPSIALPIFLLVIVAILAATAVAFAITFAGPPPRPMPVALGDVAAALRGLPARRFDGAPMRVEPAAPSSASGESAYPQRDAAIRALLGGGTVRGYYDDARSFRDAPDRPAHQLTELRGSFTVGWHDGNGWRTVRSPPNRQFSRWLAATLAGMTSAFAVLALAAWLIIRAIARPLRDLATAAQAAPTAGSAADFPIAGPREVRALGEALGAMHARLVHHAENRTAMLAAIVHDLGTPLTRLAYWVEQLPEAARNRAAGDIDEMRAMMGDVLRFARDERLDTRDRIDLGSVLDALIDDLAVAGQPVAIIAGPRVVVFGDVAALRRLFANLVENAVRYGHHAAVSWRSSGDEVAVTIDDSGPGFDPAGAQRLFAPFVRGDPSRNRATGGTGLGLAIVQSIVQAHGGRVALGNHAGGGRVTVTLPTATP